MQNKNFCDIICKEPQYTNNKIITTTTQISKRFEKLIHK